MEFRYKRGMGEWGWIDLPTAFLEAEEGPVIIEKAAEAIELAREVLRFYGAPLEEPKPEPKIGQVWRDANRGRLVVFKVEPSRIWWMTGEGDQAFDPPTDFLGYYEFIAESWAGEEK